MLDLNGIDGETIGQWVILAIVIVILLWRKFTKQDNSQESSFLRPNNSSPGKLMLALFLGIVIVIASDEVYAHYKLAKVWDQYSFLKLVVDDQPDRFSELEDYMLMVAKDSQLTQTQLTAFNKIMGEIQNEIFSNYLPTTTDEAAVAYLKANLHVLKDLNEKDPEACFNWFYGEKAKGKSLREVSSNTLEEYEASIEKIIRQSISNPQPKIDNESSAKIARDVAIQLKKKLPQELLIADPLKASTKDEKQKVCRVSIAFTEMLLTFPSDQVAAFTKRQFSIK